VDDHRLQLWGVTADGRVQVRSVADGRLLVDRSLTPDGRAPTASSFAPDGRSVAFGYEDGTVRTGTVRFVTEFLEEDAVGEEVRALRRGASVPHALGMVTVTPEGQYRYEHLSIDLEEPLATATGAIRLLDYARTPSGNALGILSADGSLAIASVTERRNFMTDELERTVTQRQLAYEPAADRSLPAFLRLSGIGNTLYLAWRDGHLLRFDARAEALAQGLTLGVVETTDLVGPGRELDHLGWMNGKTTLLAADSEGTIRAWFPTRPADAYPRDGIVLTAAHVLPGPGARVTALAPSGRSKMLAVGYANGAVRLFQVTTESLLGETSAARRVPLDSLFLAPKEDGIVALRGGELERWDLDKGYPEAGMALFRKVWYEGEVEPEHVWQSAGGTDEFEPKLGLMALVFGTLKATLYSILLGAPIAILAALFTSEFLTPRLRSPVKSVVEVMASLPSVVLGFFAAFVIAPFVRDVLGTVLTAFLVLPLGVFLGARLWQLLPGATARRLEGWPRFLAMAATIALSLGAASLLAPWLVDFCFAGDVAQWLSGHVGGPSGGWTFLLLPLCLLAAALGVGRFAGPWLRRVSMGWSRRQCAVADLVRMAVAVVAAFGVAWLLGLALGAGADPRGGAVGPYDQSNALIVGFVMGFAIVPIIYTLAEDALSSVPRDLREGSLGCGATPWQTAVRIVLPTATSGLFGALMVGLGRAVGETMIVLMAAGGTPLLDWNPFNGFRALSANIATELPEAVRGSTHYRVLFLTGLVLFAMTFVINTAAEMVRRRFRKRFAQL
jgi:phosphate transport system permease protein